MQREELNFVQKILLETLWGGSRLIAATPYWFKYSILEKILFFLLYYCLHYRLSVVRINLLNSFPDKSPKELKTIQRKFYHTLSQMFIDTVNMANMDNDKVRDVLKVKNFQQHRALVKGRDWIAMTAHFGCWEYCTLWGSFEPSQTVVAVYHPLHSSIMECFYQRLRNHKNSTTVTMRESLRYYLRHRGTVENGHNLVMGLVADQNPPWRPGSHWFHFLNQETIFFDGGEKLALRCGLPVFFVNVIRLKPGFYQLSFDQIYDGVEEVAENEITERYVRRLETMITANPELWMWSHRRWKHKRTDADN